MADNNQAPIIIKRIKKGGHGHHGGAWKVAYADFVTAMMAFFLLMWLLSVTTPEQKLGLAEFFTPTIGLKDSQGIGFKGGLKQDVDVGRSRDDLTAVGLVAGAVKQGNAPDAPNSQTGQEDPNATDAAVAKQKEDEITEIKETTDKIKQAIQDNEELKEYKNNIIVQETPEGIKIDVIDDPKTPMFVPGGAVLTDQGKKVLDSMARMIQKTPNNISISGHTDASTSVINPQYTAWELSADRALTSRRFFSTTALEPERVVKIVAMADKELLTPNEPSSPRNRRITIMLLKDSFFRDPKAAATSKSLLSTPNAELKPLEKKKEGDDDKPKDEQPVKENSIFNPANKGEAPPVSPAAPSGEVDGARPGIFQQVPAASDEH